ncbi:hypothetical protein F1737_04565 [Methanoplanus sp. FWC-SCC4]|uniref:CN hydrolase domain-containing protein n=1 Tax=Methanochimaera problematica TaxID=2609417 RepID=A0AA97FBI1_9EURY|nr:hypothetical protein [Methanoplanus sp. FWC-SCC4]WOF16027.1 hypothetical protein F1737_04565 [Methanoplanus sp. FWC-SCC4]
MFEEELKEHEILYSGASLKLGEIHWHILKSEIELDNKAIIQEVYPKYEQFEPKDCNDLDFIKNSFKNESNFTEFGKEVLGDEIHWWIYQKEDDIDELESRTEQALKYLQKIKEDIEKLKNKSVAKNYSELINEIKNFSDEHKKEIEALLDYILWLKEKDIIAPSILFSYKVWGSTNRANRRILVNGEIEESENDVILCTNIVLGLTNYLKSPILIREYMDIEYDIYSSIDPVDYQNDNYCRYINVLFNRIHYQILENIYVYFENIRDSLNAIKDEIKQFQSESNPTIRLIDRGTRETKNIVRFALVQLDYSVSLNPQSEPFGYFLENEKVIKDKVFSALSIAKENQINVICFPELSFNKEWIDEMISDYNEMIIIGGSYYENAQNLCPIIIEGELIEPPYAKCQPSTSEKSPKKDRKMIPGKILYVFQTRFGNFSVLNCIDYSKYSRHVINNSKYSVDFIINPCYDKSIKRFEENSNLDCKDSDVTIIRVNRSYLDESSKYGRSSIICKEHDSVLENFQNEGFRGDKDVKYLILKFDDERIMITDIDVEKAPSVDLTTGYEQRVSIINQYQYIEGNWTLDS